ncbi:hypothetical protein GYB61_09985 [bacterium]|nr:hypothetical protein [bacterium]
MEDWCFITPTFHGDLGRFALLRESMAAFGAADVPHYALIETEDVPAFERAGLDGVTLLPSCDLLDPEVERRRLAFKRSGPPRWQRIQRSVHKRTGMLPGSRYFGWNTQQLLKLAASASLPHDIALSFDSDNIVTAPLLHSNFVRSDGTVALYQQRGRLQHARKPGGWYGHACMLLDRPPPTQAGDDEHDYVTHPFVFERRVTQQLLAWLEQHHNQPWWDCLLNLPLGQLSEFMIYGVFVDTHLHYDGVFTQPARAYNRWLDTEQQRRNADEEIAAIFADPDARFLVLQADHHNRWPVEKFTPIVRQHLRAAQQSPTSTSETRRRRPQWQSQSRASRQ